MNIILKDKEQILKWLKDHNILNFELIADETYGFVVDVFGDVILSNLGLNHIPVKFNIIYGDFNCSCNQLKNLNFAPVEVKLTFDCFSNLLSNLIGAPIKIGKSFYCHNNQLISLFGCPQNVPDELCISNNKLKSLEYCATSVGFHFDCKNNLLTSLQYCPKHVGASFICADNLLTSLKYAPEEIGGAFVCSNNKLKSLRFLSKQIRGSLSFTNNNISALKYLPKGCSEIHLRNNPIASIFQNTAYKSCIPFEFARQHYLYEINKRNLQKLNKKLENTLIVNSDNFTKPKI